MLAEYHAVSGAWKLPKASGDHMLVVVVVVVRGADMKTVFSVFLTSNAFAEVPSF